VRKTYRGTQIEVTFDLNLCTHYGECLRGDRGTFRIDRRPWIQPEGADSNLIAEVIERCPSGALQYRRLDGGPEEAHEGTRVTPLRNGPLLVVGEIEVRSEDGEVHRLPRATLCRCGQSKNKPFCDNTHLKIGFQAPGEVFKIRLSPVRQRITEPIARSDDPRGEGS
jgi:uncharacterized Fe-S cluster protein YjdI/CDGSH-type Zn-finger protein